MDKKQFEIMILSKYSEENIDLTYAEEFIDYSYNLYNQGLPVITSPRNLSEFIGLDYYYLLKMAYKPKWFYRSFYIEKSNGKKRLINEPLPDLKFVQEWILKNILEKIPISPYAKAFVKGKGVKDNARFHRNQAVLVSLDIKDFFSNIKIFSVIKVFEKIGYCHSVSCFLGYLCCLGKCLPQGAPTSPYISNLYMLDFDNNISKYAVKRRIRYTRYADDMTFSGELNPSEVIGIVKRLLYKKGLVLNYKKTRVASKNQRQETTGIVVNSSMNVPKEYKKRIRQEMYYINKYGFDSHYLHIGEIRANYIYHLLGKINYVLYVNPNNKEMINYKKILISYLE